MSEFVARIVAELDTSKVAASIENIKNQKIVLQNATIDNITLSSSATSSISAQIQKALNAQNFSVNVKGINFSGQSGSNSAANIGTKMGASISDALNKRIQLKLDTGSYEAQIAKLKSKLTNLDIPGSTQNFSGVKSNLEDINSLLSNMKTGKTSSLVSDAAKLEEKLSGVKNQLDMDSTAAKTFVSSFKVKAFDSKLDSWLENNSKAAKQFGNDIKKLKDDLASLDKNAVPSSLMKEFEARYKQIDSAASGEGLKGKTIKDQFKGAVASIGKYVSASGIIYHAIDGLKEMYKAVYDIDTAMVNLKKVTDETDSTYTAFLSRASESAQDLGRSVSSLVEQTADWAKLGYNLQESEELAKVSSIYANVGEVDDATAVSDLVTAMKAFNLTASDALGIVDSLNILGKRIARRLLYRLKDGDI